MIDVLVEEIAKKERAILKEMTHHINLRYFPTLEFILGKTKMEEEMCPICLEGLKIKNIEEEIK